MKMPESMRVNVTSFIYRVTSQDGGPQNSIDSRQHTMLIGKRVFSQSLALACKWKPKRCRNCTIGPSLGAGRHLSFSSQAELAPPSKPVVSSSSDLVHQTQQQYLPIDFRIASKIEGEESQIATITLNPGEALRAESGAMLYMTERVVMDTKLEGVSSAFSRYLTGQNLFLSDFHYEGEPGTTGIVCLGTDFYSKILRLSLEDFEGGALICQRGAYLASNPSVRIDIEFTKSLTAGFFGGQGFILQKLSGQGDVLIKGGGTLVKRDLQAGESIRVTSGSIVAFAPTVHYDVQMMPGITNAIFGGEGLFITTLTGPGPIWLQSMPPDRMIAEIARRMPSGGIGFGIPIGGGASGASDQIDSETAGEAAAPAVMSDGMATPDGGDPTSSVQVEGDANGLGKSGDADFPFDHSGDTGTAAGYGGQNSTSGLDDSSSLTSRSTDSSFSEPPRQEPTFQDENFSDQFEGDFEDGEVFDDPTSEGSTGDETVDQVSSVLRSIWDLFSRR